MEIRNPRRILVVGPADAGHLELTRALLCLPQEHALGSTQSPNSSPSRTLTDVDLPDTTATAPEAATPAVIAGQTHLLPLKTAYYRAEVPMWLDVVSPESLEEWTNDYLSADAAPVLEALGAFVLIFRQPIIEQGLSGMGKMNDEPVDRRLQEIKDMLREVGRVVDRIKEGSDGSYSWDGAVLAVGMPDSLSTNTSTACRSQAPIQPENPPQPMAAGNAQDMVDNDRAISHCTSEHILTEEDWEDLCLARGFEWIDGAATGVNEYKEVQGLARLRQALEACEWAAAGAHSNDDMLEDFESDLRTVDHGGTSGMNGCSHSEQAQSDSGGSPQLELDLSQLQTDDLAEMRQAMLGHDSDDGAQEDGVERLEVLILKLQAARERGLDLPEAERKRFAAKAVQDLMKTI